MADRKRNFPGIQSVHWAQEKDLASWKGVTKNWVIFKPGCLSFSFETEFWDKHSVKFNYSSVNKYVWSANTVLLQAERGCEIPLVVLLKKFANNKSW